MYHTDAEHATIYFKLNTADLLYKGDGSGGTFKARVRVSYATYADWNSRQLLDSASTLVQDRNDAPNDERELIGSKEVRREAGRPFVVKLVARDLNRDNESALVLRVEGSGPDARQSFMPMLAIVSAQHETQYSRLFRS